MAKEKMLEKTMRVTNLEYNIVLCLRNSEVLTLPLIIEFAKLHLENNDIKNICYQEFKALYNIMLDTKEGFI